LRENGVAGRESTGLQTCSSGSSPRCSRPPARHVVVAEMNPASLAIEESLLRRSFGANSRKCTSWENRSEIIEVNRKQAESPLSPGRSVEGQLASCKNGLRCLLAAVNLIELAILRPKIGEVWSDAHLSAACPFDKLVRLKLASMLIEVFTEPGVQRIELAHCDLIRDVGMCVDSGSIELRAQNIPDGVTLKRTTHTTRVPVDVL